MDSKVECQQIGAIKIIAYVSTRGNPRYICKQLHCNDDVQ